MVMVVKYNHGFNDYRILEIIIANDWKKNLHRIACRYQYTRIAGGYLFGKELKSILNKYKYL